MLPGVQSPSKTAGGIGSPSRVAKYESFWPASRARAQMYQVSSHGISGSKRIEPSVPAPGLLMTAISPSPSMLMLSVHAPLRVASDGTSSISWISEHASPMPVVVPESPVPVSPGSSQVAMHLPMASSTQVSLHSNAQQVASTAHTHSTTSASLQPGPSCTSQQPSATGPSVVAAVVGSVGPVVAAVTSPVPTLGCIVVMVGVVRLVVGPAPVLVPVSSLSPSVSFTPPLGPHATARLRLVVARTIQVRF